jgi:hypothetical protein
MTKRAKLDAITKRLAQTIELHENEKRIELKSSWRSDIYHLNKMLRDAMIEVAYEMLGVNKLYSMKVIGAQLAQLCRDIQMASKDKDEAQEKIKPLIAAWYVLGAFPNKDLTIIVE